MCMCIYVCYGQTPTSRRHVTGQSLKEASNGDLMGHVSSSQMIAKAKEFLKPKRYLFHLYRQIFDIVIALWNVLSSSKLYLVSLLT